MLINKRRKYVIICSILFFVVTTDIFIINVKSNDAMKIKDRRTVCGEIATHVFVTYLQWSDWIWVTLAF